MSFKEIFILQKFNVNVVKWNHWNKILKWNEPHILLNSIFVQFGSNFCFLPCLKSWTEFLWSKIKWSGPSVSQWGSQHCITISSKMYWNVLKCTEIYWNLRNWGINHRCNSSVGGSMRVCIVSAGCWCVCALCCHWKYSRMFCKSLNWFTTNAPELWSHPVFCNIWSHKTLSICFWISNIKQAQSNILNHFLLLWEKPARSSHFYQKLELNGPLDIIRTGLVFLL